MKKMNDIIEARLERIRIEREKQKLANMQKLHATDIPVFRIIANAQAIARKYRGREYPISGGEK